jgi:hypothetical protein
MLSRFILYPKDYWKREIGLISSLEGILGIGVIRFDFA